MLLALCLILPDSASSGPYTDSAHGDTTYGVNRKRTSIETGFGYSRGNCAHCHEQHASIGGQTITPKGYELFYDNYVNQTNGVCFKCHDNTTTYSTTAIVNRSYSYRAGGWTADTLNDILEAFTNPPSISSHDLGDIRTFITGKSWGYTSDSNPCAACHNPHRAQGDPFHSDLPKSTGARGWPVSRPSQHSKDNNAWGLWGDGTSEKMSDYASGLRYQAPYRNGSTSAYEPDGSTTQDGSNLADFVTFCQDCHSSSMTGSPYNLSHTPIDWATSAGDKHGKRAADATSGNYIDIDNPFSNTYGGQYVLSCTDCHEPHGAPNLMLIRKEVNGAVLGTISTLTSTDCTAVFTDNNKELGYLCNRCHKDDADAGIGAAYADRWCYVHHQSSDAPYSPSSCGTCHESGSGMGCTSNRSAINCNCCHFHGSDDSAAPSGWRTGRRTF
jgi:hypothetical protein